MEIFSSAAPAAKIRAQKRYHYSRRYMGIMARPAVFHVLQQNHRSPDADRTDHNLYRICHFLWLRLYENRKYMAACDHPLLQQQSHSGTGK